MVAWARTGGLSVNIVSPRLYRTFALPWEKRLADEAHRLGLPYALHICGRTDRILDDMLATGADALELDYKTTCVWRTTA